MLIKRIRRLKLDFIAFWNMLGTTKRIVFYDVELFRDEITQYVGSGSYQSNTESQDSDEEMDDPRIPSQIWPLVKKVVIYYKAAVLAGGVSFVDLPGRLFDFDDLLPCTYIFYHQVSPTLIRPGITLLRII